MTLLSKKNLKKAKPDNIRRLARWLKLKNTEEMSIRQHISLLNWYFTRPEKRRRGLTLW